MNRIAIRLVIPFLVILLVLAGAYIAAIWVTIDTSTASSVDSVADTLHTFLIIDLESRLGSVLDKMSLILNLWAASDLQNDFYPARVSRFAFSALSKTTDMMFLSVTRAADGHIIGAMRIPSGDIVAGERPPTVGNQTVNMTFWLLDGDIKTVYNTYPYDARTRGWYKTAVARKGLTFDKPFPSLSEGILNLPLMLPIFSTTDGSIVAVLEVTYLLDRLGDALKTIHAMIRNAGMMAIFSDDGTVIAGSSGHPNTLAADLQALYVRMNSTLPKGQTSVNMISFSTFGNCFFIQHRFELSAYTTASDWGLNWTLVMVLPKADYYDLINRYDKIVGAYTGVYIALVVVVGCVTFQFLAVRPLARIASQLRAQGVRGTAAAEDTGGGDEGEGGRRSSWWTEIQQLYLAIRAAAASSPPAPGKDKTLSDCATTAATPKPIASMTSNATSATTS